MFYSKPVVNGSLGHNKREKNENPSHITEILLNIKMQNALFNWRQKLGDGRRMISKIYKNKETNIFDRAVTASFSV